MIDVQQIDDIEELGSYRLLWNSWLHETPHASFVHTPEWLETYWRHFGRGQELRALVVRSAGRPIGIVPLSIRTDRHRFGTVRVLGYPADDWSPWYGLIGSNPPLAMLAAMQHIRHAKRDWDLCELRGTAASWRDGSRTARSMRIVGLPTDERPHQTTSIIEFTGSWHDYLATKPRKTRHEFRRSLRRLRDRNGIQYLRHRPAPARAGDGDPAWDLYAMCEHVALSSWQGSSTTGNSLTHGHLRPFLRDAHATAARLGMLDMNLLMADGRPVAFAYNYHFGGRLSCLRIGYDPAFSRQGFGKALLLRSIDDSFVRGDASYELGPGNSRLARQLRTHTDTSYRLTHVPMRSWRSQAIRCARWVETWKPAAEFGFRQPSPAS
jgi:CelD/BcsL family acetyltransferase involved in cellulose biosynthesis